MCIDTCFICPVFVENLPINNSPYYAFKTWANSSRSFYFTFKYPKGYKHRYTPKIETNGVWSVIDSSNIFKNDSLVTIKVKLNKSPLTIAAQEIQSSKHVKAWYTDLVKGKENIVTIKSIGKTAPHRTPINVRTIVGDRTFAENVNMGLICDMDSVDDVLVLNNVVPKAVYCSWLPADSQNGSGSQLIVLWSISLPA